MSLASVTPKNITATGSTAKADTKAKVETAKPKADATPTSTTTQDKASVGPAETAKEDPRAAKLLDGLGDNYGSSTQKTDKWKKGPNDTIEGMLKGRGFSLKDIYTKDKSGKNMVDRVMGANGIKDARKIQDGQELLLPDLGKKGGGTSTTGLKPGETTGQKEIGAHKIESKVNADGSKQSNVDTNNGTSVQAKGPGDTTNATRVREDGSTTSQTLNKDKNGQVTTQTDTTTKGSKDTIETKAIKGNLEGEIGAEGGTVRNGDVEVKTEHKEENKDGLFENAGRKVASFFGHEEKPPEAVKVTGKDVKTEVDGNNVTVSADGKKVAEFDQDADDSWLERGGAAVDKGVQVVADTAKKGYEVAKDAAVAGYDNVKGGVQNAWNWLTNW